MDDEANDALFGTGDGSEEPLALDLKPKKKKKNKDKLVLDGDALDDEMADDMAELDLGTKKKKKKKDVSFMPDVESVLCL